ncbi:hypothetical protein ACHAXT_003013 [Thalassiosira profunda]
MARILALSTALASLVFMPSASDAVASSPDPPGEEWEATFFIAASSPAYVEYEHELNTALRHYREMADGILRQLALSHEVASRTEAMLFPHHKHNRRCDDDGMIDTPTFLSCRLEQTMSKVAHSLDQNVAVLQELLRPFPVTVGVSTVCDGDGSNDSSNSHFTFPPSKESIDEIIRKDTQAEPGSQVLPLARYIPPYNPSKNSDNKFDGGEEEPYDTASHIITHMARDWTAVGAEIRKDAHDWIVDQIWRYHNARIKENASLEVDAACTHPSVLSPVLVPGAGTGRLAFDIAFASSNGRGIEERRYPFAVEAVDNSIVMAAASHHLLKVAKQSGAHIGDVLEIYPLAADPYVNEEDTERRWESAVFPEEAVSEQFHQLRVSMQQPARRPRLAYVIGDFVTTYALPAKHGQYGTVATCFFIDTATNIYEYILTVRNLLRPGGVWINLGPVQWHRNAQLSPSTSELKDMLVLAGFQIDHWEMSDKFLAYRHPDDIRKGTRAEAYRPLKFVAVLLPDGNGEAQCDDAMENGSDLVPTLDKLRFATGRKSMMNEAVATEDD